MDHDALKKICAKSPWKSNHSSVWLASMVHLRRNIEKFTFPSKLDLEKRKQVVSLLGKELANLSEVKNTTLIKAEDLSAHDKEFLTEHYFSEENIQHAHHGEAFVVNRDGTFFASLNLHDHIHVQVLDYKEDLEAAWNRSVEVERALGRAIAYAYSPRFGFLTSNPNHCGTGLEVRVFLQLPALIHSKKFDEMKPHFENAVEASGLQGATDQIVGDIIVLKNRYSLAVNEENILSSLRSQATKLTLAENSERSLIKKEGNSNVMDEVSRAFGLLRHSYQIETQEALGAISLVKLGVELEWIQGCDLAALNTLFFDCQRAHLLHRIKKDVSQEDLLHNRAEHIHKTLSGVSIHC